MNIKNLPDDFKTKVQREYEQGYNHIRPLRESKRDIISKILDPNLPEGQVRIPLFWKNVQLELALFLTDDLSIEVLTNNGILGAELMENANKVLKYDDVDMDLYEMREDIVNHNAIYGLSATIIDARDEDEKQPISDTIHPLSLIIDPKNYKGSKMRYIGVERRLSIDWLKETKGFNTDNIENASTSEQLNKIERDNADANNLQKSNDNEGMTDVYDHFNVYKDKKYLSTWINDRTDCIRLIELAPLTEAEQLKPTKVKFPIQLHRRKPKFGSVCGVSIGDEVLVFQDIISQLTNLQLINTRIQALGPDIFVDERLGVDTTLLGQGKPGGRVLNIENKTGMPTQNGIFSFTPPNPSQYTDLMIQNLERRAEETTNVSSQNFGVSQPGSQTKAEIQTLQQNANQILMWISNNYLRGQKDYRTEHYRSYALNMGKGKKCISLYQKGTAISLELKRDEFIADGKVNINIVSKSQERLENDKEFDKLTFVSNLYLPNITSEYAKNELLRLLGDKSNVRDFDSKKYIRESVDEIKAKQGLLMLNNNIEVSEPEMGENADIYLDIYKQAMDTPAKAKAIEQYMDYSFFVKEQELKAQQMPMQQPGVGSGAVNNIAMNNLNNQAVKTPSTAGVIQ